MERLSLERPRYSTDLLAVMASMIQSMYSYPKLGFELISNTFMVLFVLREEEILSMSLSIRPDALKKRT